MYIMFVRTWMPDRPSLTFGYADLRFAIENAWQAFAVRGVVSVAVVETQSGGVVWELTVPSRHPAWEGMS